MTLVTLSRTWWNVNCNRPQGELMGEGWSQQEDDLGLGV